MREGGGRGVREGGREGGRREGGRKEGGREGGRKLKSCHVNVKVSMMKWR